MIDLKELDIRLLLSNKYLLNTTEKETEEIAELIGILKHNNVSKPIIYIDITTASKIAGAEITKEYLSKYLENNKIDADIIEVGSLGLLSSLPIIAVQLPGKTRIVFEKITFGKVEPLLDSILNNIIPFEYVLFQYNDGYNETWEDVPFIYEIDFFKYQHRNIIEDCGIINPIDINEYIARKGYRSFLKLINNYSSEEACEIIVESELKGRAGEGFLAGVKWKRVLSADSDKKYIICNAEESDPGAFFNRILIESNPHKVIESVLIGAYCIGADNAYIYIRNNYELAITRLETALLQAKEYRLIGSNIFKSGYSINIHLFKAADAFVCGEETALIKTIEGKRGMPNYKPPFPTEKGLFGKPTVVNNLETLCNVPSIIKNGPIWYKTIGAEIDKGTKIISISGKSVNKGIAEIKFGTQFIDIINIIGGGIRESKNLKAILLSGPLGCLIPASNIDIEFSYQTFIENNINIGSGSLVLLDENSCILDVSKYYFDYLRKQSCGKCIPCREGTRQVYEILSMITNRRSKESGHQTLERFKGVMQLEDIASVMNNTSLCGLGKNASNIITNILRDFRKEIEEHIFDRKCVAGSCKELKTYTIDSNLCNGCNACAHKCPTNAILGTIMNTHYIIEEKCIGCDKCFETCKFSAIFVN